MTVSVAEALVSIFCLICLIFCLSYEGNKPQEGETSFVLSIRGLLEKRRLVLPWGLSDAVILQMLVPSMY